MNTDTIQTFREVPNYAISDHFVDVNKMVELDSGNQREVDDIGEEDWEWLKS